MGRTILLSINEFPEEIKGESFEYQIFIPFLCTIIRILFDDNNSLFVLKPVRLYQTLYTGEQLFADLSIH